MAVIDPWPGGGVAMAGIVGGAQFLRSSEGLLRASSGIMEVSQGVGGTEIFIR